LSSECRPLPPFHIHSAFFLFFLFVFTYFLVRVFFFFFFFRTCSHTESPSSEPRSFPLRGTWTPLLCSPGFFLNPTFAGRPWDPSPNFQDASFLPLLSGTYCNFLLPKHPRVGSFFLTCGRLPSAKSLSFSLFSLLEVLLSRPWRRISQTIRGVALYGTLFFSRFH